MQAEALSEVGMWSHEISKYVFVFFLILFSIFLLKAVFWGLGRIGWKMPELFEFFITITVAVIFSTMVADAWF